MPWTYLGLYPWVCPSFPSTEGLVGSSHATPSRSFRVAYCPRIACSLGFRMGWTMNGMDEWDANFTNLCPFHRSFSEASIFSSFLWDVYAKIQTWPRTSTLSKSLRKADSSNEATMANDHPVSKPQSDFVPWLASPRVTEGFRALESVNKMVVIILIFVLIIWVSLITHA